MDWLEWDFSRPSLVRWGKSYARGLTGVRSDSFEFEAYWMPNRLICPGPRDKHGSIASATLRFISHSESFRARVVIISIETDQAIMFPQRVRHNFNQLNSNFRYIPGLLQNIKQLNEMRRQLHLLQINENCNHTVGRTCITNTSTTVAMPYSYLCAKGTNNHAHHTNRPVSVTAYS